MADPLSLAHYFDAPDGYRGVFGWICGYSADAVFLNDAAERFTRETKGQRAARGSLSLALMLDPGQPAIPPIDVPGLIHLPILRPDRKPFRLLHAKIALLGFRQLAGDEGWKIRLLVSTGNWTRQTLEESLDLGWCIEVDSGEFGGDDEDLELRCADVVGAWSMFAFLRKLFDLRVLKAGAGMAASTAQAATKELARWIKRCTANASAGRRFLDSRQASLLAQLPDAVQAHAGGLSRNYLAMGSGFFEGPPPGGPAVPPVLDRVVAELTARGLLTQLPNVDIFVNPAACQAVAPALPALQQRVGWHVRKAALMEHLFGRTHRSLHAKFLFSASERDGNSNCLRPWVYLGSGNLTGPGFACPMSPQGGNLEAGVVFAGKVLTWYPGRDVDPDTIVTNLLPIQWNTVVAAAGDLRTGTGIPPPAPPFLAPPVAWLAWQASEGGGWLSSPHPSATAWDVLDDDGEPCHSAPEGFPWTGMRPRQARIRWQDSTGRHACFIPVIDEFGRLAAAPLGALDFDEAWWALAGFPTAASEDDDSDEDEDSELRQLGTGGGGGGGAGTYPVRQMMELVERIAARQTDVARVDWLAWCARLEQTLSRVAGSPVLAYFCTLRINPLSPLRGPAFRPEYAEDGTTRDGEIYEEVLRRIEIQWQTAGLAEIGGQA